jgi:hypothetical protein
MQGVGFVWHSIAICIFIHIASPCCWWRLLGTPLVTKWQHKKWWFQIVIATPSKSAFLLVMLHLAKVSVNHNSNWIQVMQ